jgi:hypothetical protein
VSNGARPNPENSWQLPLAIFSSIFLYSLIIPFYSILDSLYSEREILLFFPLNIEIFLEFSAQAAASVSGPGYALDSNNIKAILDRTVYSIEQPADSESARRSYLHADVPGGQTWNSAGPAWIDSGGNLT